MSIIGVYLSLYICCLPYLPVDSIVISEKDKKLHIKINLNAKFKRHKDCYDEEGNITERIFIA